MNLYTTLTIRYLKQNKKRTIVTIIGVILSTALICGIGNIYESFMDYQIRTTIDRTGDMHATFYDIEKENLDIITKSAGISKSSLSDNLGYSKLSEEKDNLVEVKAYDKNAFEVYQVKLKEGKLPNSENEIVLSEGAIPFTNKKIGDSITLNIGERINEYEEQKDTIAVSEDEAIVNSERRIYKIVGIIEKPEYEIGNDVITGISYLDINNQQKNNKLNVSISANKPTEIYDIAKNISNNLGLDIENTDGDGENLIYNNDTNTYYENLSFNEHLLRLHGASTHANINETINNILVIVTSLVILCTIATVYNAFSISVSERRKQFGILNSIGATRMQVMKLVFVEAFIVSIIGIPLGIIAGTFAIDLVFKLIQMVYSTSFISDMGLRIVYKPYVIIGSFIIVLLTIFTSAILPAINSAKTSPLDTIRNSSNIKLGKVKSSKLVKLIFKTEGVLAYKNLRRNKKKFRITLFSLIISVVIFISFSGFITLFKEGNKVNTGEINYDIRLWKSGIKEENSIVDDLNNIDGVNKVSVSNSYSVGSYIDEKDINKEYKDLIEQYSYKESKDGNVYYNFDIDINETNIQFAQDKDIEDLELKTGNIDKENAIKENGIILRNKSAHSEPGKKYDISLTNYEVGDTINAYKILDRDKDGNVVKEHIKLKVLATTEDFLPGNKYSTYMGIDFITYEEVGLNLGYEISDTDIYIDSNKSKETRKSVKDIGEKYGYDVYDEVESVLEMEETIKIFEIFVYGFITVISLVSATNIINTISTNINLRKREFAIIKSIGVTPNGFNRIIYLESLLYAFIALLYGIPIGLSIVILMNTVLGGIIVLGMILPWDAVLMSIVGLLILTFISAYIPLKKINKENIVDNIRQESI